MEIYERIRELRKKHLKMSMEMFGTHLGVSRDTINNIELNRLARPEQKLSLYKLICSEFGVNEEWLLNGVEPMFAQDKTFNLDDFVKSRGCTELELDILKAYFELDPNIRNHALDHFKNRLTPSLPSTNTSDLYTNEIKQEPITTNIDKAADALSLEEAEAAYIKKTSSSAQRTDSSVSNTEGDTEKKGIKDA